MTDQTKNPATNNAGKTTQGPGSATPTWAEQKTKLKAKFSNLTDADLEFSDGKKDEMLKKLQSKLGKSQVELNAIISGL